MHTLLQDIRYGARILLRAPGFALLAAGLLALGIGALAAIFTVVDATLLRPLPFAQPENLVMLWEKPGDYAHNRVSPLNFQDWHDQNSVFSSMAAVAGSTATLQSSEGPEQLTGQAVTSEFFSLLGVQPVLGRAFTQEDDAKQADVALISESLWRQRFGSDPKVLGSTLSVNGKPTAIIGVVPARVAILWKSDFSSLYHVKRSPEQRKIHYLSVLARLRPGVSVPQAQASMDVIADNLARNFPNTNKSWGINVEPLRAAVVSHDFACDGAGSLWHCWFCLAYGLRQRCQSDAGPRGCPQSRDGGSRRLGCGQQSSRTPALDRKLAAGVAGRHWRSAAGLDDGPHSACRASAGHSARGTRTYS